MTYTLTINLFTMFKFYLVGCFIMLFIALEHRTGSETKDEIIRDLKNKSLLKDLVFMFLISWVGIIFYVKEALPIVLRKKVVFYFINNQHKTGYVINTILHYVYDNALDSYNFVREKYNSSKYDPRDEYGRYSRMLHHLPYRRYIRINSILGYDIDMDEEEFNELKNLSYIHREEIDDTFKNYRFKICQRFERIYGDRYFYRGGK